MGRRSTAAALVAGALTAVGTPASALTTAPERVVSMNLCADQLAVLLLPRERIASVSRLAGDPGLSFVADRVAGLAVNHGAVEEILPLAPDLVLAGSFTARPAVAFLKTKGIPVMELGIPRDFDAIRAQVRAVAGRLGTGDRAEALLAEMDRTLAAVRPPDEGRRPRAVAWQAGGFTAGSGTMTDAVLRAAGYDNLAALAGIRGNGYLTMEAVVAGRPDLLIGETGLPGRPSLRQALLTHPALDRPGAVGARIAVPGALWACGGPFTAEAVRLLRERR